MLLRTLRAVPALRRLVQRLHSDPRGWRALPDVLNLLWGPAIEVRQQRVAVEVDRNAQDAAAAQLGIRKTRSAGTELVGVVFLGGVSLAEVAAIRRLNASERKRHREAERMGGASSSLRQFVIFTTEVLSARSLVESLRDGPAPD